MKITVRVAVAVAVVVVAAVLAAVRFQNYHAAQSWHIEVRQRAPVYEHDTYPYATGSPHNRVVGYLELGEVPTVSAVGYGKDYVYWRVQLTSGERGYLFDPDVEVSRES